MAGIESQRDEFRKQLSQLVECFATQLASELLNHPPLRRQGDYYVPDVALSAGVEGVANPTDDQVKMVRRQIAPWTIDLIGAAIDQKGLVGGSAATDLLCQFFKAAGMIQRLRCAEIERRHRESKAGGCPDYSVIPTLWPRWVEFWSTPKIHYQSRLDGTNSLEGVDREELVNVAVEFYRSGIRHACFEKCLIEALLHAELYATVKCSRQGEFSATFTERLLRAWAFDKTRGDEPAYSLYTLLGYLLKGGIGLGVFGALTAWALISYERGASWKNVSALIVLAVITASALGRWLIRLVVKWAQPDRKITAAAFLQNHPVLRAINELEKLTKIVAAPVMSLSLAQEAGLRCYSNGGSFDQIVMPYLDRAIAAGEFVWTGHCRSFEFEEYVEETDLDTEI